MVSRIGGGIEGTTERSLRAWMGEDDPRVQAARAAARRAVVSPTPRELLDARPRLDALLRGDDVRFLVPMFEPEDPVGRVPLGTLEYLLDELGVDPAHILLLDQGSAPGPCARARATGVRIVDTDAAARALPSSFLAAHGLEVAHRGKGLNLFLGAAMLVPERPRWVVLADADLRAPTRWDFARTLAFPLLEGAPRMVVGAHVGRNNDAVFALRVALEALEAAPLSDAARARVAALGPGLRRQVHMLAGERIVAFDQLTATPLATGYGAEACLTVAALERPSLPILQVADPRPRQDIPNGPSLAALIRNEQRMMNCIARLLLFLVTRELPLIGWARADVRAANAALGAMLPGVALLPESAGPVEVVGTPPERLLPPVRTLDANVLAAIHAAGEGA